MAKVIQFRRGTTAEHETFTGAEGEVTVDTTKQTLVVHDGETAGGYPLVTEGGASSLSVAYADSAGTATSATTATNLGSSTVGGTAKPIYLNAGAPTAISDTVGSGTKPVYLSSGTVTASDSTAGGSTTPVYLNGGTLTAISTHITAATVGPSAAVSIAKNSSGSIAVPYFKYNAYGKITASGTRTLTVNTGYCSYCSYCTYCSHCTYCSSTLYCG